MDWARLFPGSTEAVEVEMERDEHKNVCGANVNDSAMEKLQALVNFTAVK